MACPALKFLDNKTKKRLKNATAEPANIEKLSEALALETT